jgi:type IV fimbrial biogenesis protein FimT
VLNLAADVSRRPDIRPLSLVARIPLPSSVCSSGYTLLELLTVILIVGIFTAIGIPSFQYVTYSNRMSSEVNSLLADMQYARSEAVKEGQPITVCTSSNATSASPSCSGSDTWNTGWIVFIDANGNQKVDTGEQTLRGQAAFTNTDTFIGGASVSAVTFNREGYVSAYDPPTQVTLPLAITLHSTPLNNQWTRCLALSFAGTPTTINYGATTPTTCS